ncbi:hypothetical protein BDV96DRAFT_568557 [Lophiotrema nucula]|uniref:F-box domain-containing protein n=1 Tax=Lophiotrema nucula TaxID=690887 RepID=A0A6A5ZH44_9PLEO|nr:hypothetical protein BDV96DRAFT_568557 [Lophiotrema nucula]
MTTVVGAARWLAQHLTLLWPRRLPAGLGAFALPLEITLLIATHLPEPAVVCLALTCRTLYSTLFPRPYLNAAEKEELLLLLEKDIATVYFCCHCIKLHRWHIRWDGSIFPFFEMPCTLRDNLIFTYTCGIPYHLARLLMNRQLNGSAHGPPLHKIETKTRLYDLSTMRGDPQALRASIDANGSKICEHLYLAEKNWYASVQVPELAKDKNAPSYFAPCHQSFGSCTLCMTDYCINIYWNDEKKHYVVELSVWRELGDCRSPFDWTWRVIKAPALSFDGQRALKYRRGIVRDRWNRAEGIDGNTEGSWVEIPACVRRAATRSSR